MIVDIATGELDLDTVSESKKQLKRRGRAGGLKGGKARAKRLTPQEREDIAKLTARARWKKTD